MPLTTLPDPSSGPPGVATTPPRVVLDTNVCLDLFVFAEPNVARLLEALQRGEVVAVTNGACREEWLLVLRYPMLKLDERAIAAAITAHDALVLNFDDAIAATDSRGNASQSSFEEQGVASATSPGAAVGPRLPRCADPDDQKFLQLAHACGAQWLLSRDKAVLALARRTQRDGLFRILPPADWHADA